MGSCPKIVLVDTQTSEQIDLWDLFGTDVLDHHESGWFTIEEKELHIIYFQVAAAHDAGHRLNFCAHKRTVRSENLGARIPNLTSSLKDPATDKSFVYCGYVSGDYLDDTVSLERTEFEETTELEGRLAEIVCNQIPWVESVQFLNSGSKATYHGIPLARAATGRSHIIVIQGGYTGWHNDVACNLTTHSRSSVQDAR